MDLADNTFRNTLRSAIDGLAAFGGTAGHIGAAWGWYMLSPNWTSVWPSDSDPRPYGNDVVKAVLLMTDGDFNTSYRNGNMNSTDVSAAGSSSYQATQLCTNMKAAGIKIYSVAFQSPPAAEALLRACASEPGDYYDANTAGDLKNYFRDIAEKLTSLRIAR
jgi:hypothetical protein